MREGGRGRARGEKGAGPRGEGEESEEEGRLGWARAGFAGPGGEGESWARVGKGLGQLGCFAELGWIKFSYFLLPFLFLTKLKSI